jgi:hypothetical protein
MFCCANTATAFPPSHFRASATNKQNKTNKKQRIKTKEIKTTKQKQQNKKKKKRKGIFKSRTGNSSITSSILA